MPVSELVDLFLKWATQHLAPATVKHYRSRLKPFVTTFANRKFKKLTPADIENYLAKVNAWPDGSLKAPDTRRANAIAIERLQAWARDQRIIKKKIVKKLEKPAGRNRDRIPTRSETAQLLRHATPAFRTIYQALRRSAARPGELCGAKIKDIHIDEAGNRTIVLEKHKTVRKTKKPRRIPLGTKLAKLIDRAIGNRTDKQAPIFLSPRGKQWSPQHLSRTYCNLKKRAGLPGELVLYLTRHEHLTRLCQLHGVAAAKEAAGHTNINTTMRYVKPDDDLTRSRQDDFQ